MNKVQLTRDDRLEHVDLQLEHVPVHVLHERVEGQRAVAEVREEGAEALRQRERDRVRRHVVLLQRLEHHQRVRGVHLIAATTFYM